MTILMTRENPEGALLADLARELVIEISKKNENLEVYISPEAATVRRNNVIIMGLLMQVETIHRESLAIAKETRGG
jgi:hypothetical protein